MALRLSKFVWLIIYVGGCLGGPHYGLRAHGSQIVDEHGNVIRLRGVNRSGTEFACIGV
jgi:hypothetical protein